jgi:hypothetical protein
MIDLENLRHGLPAAGIHQIAESVALLAPLLSKQQQIPGI